MSKFYSKKTVIDGMVFDSKKEAQRWLELKKKEELGEIHDLQRQVKYLLIPEQREPDTIGKKGGIKKGALLERECSYYADFVYWEDGCEEPVVEDVKGIRLSDYIIKRKLMLFRHNIRVREV